MSRSMLLMEEVLRLWSRISIDRLAVLPVVDSSFSALALELQTELDGSMGLAASMDLFLVFLAVARTLLIVVLVLLEVLCVPMFQV